MATSYPLSTEYIDLSDAEKGKIGLRFYQINFLLKI